MANPNPEVYGTQDTWSKCAVFYAVGDGDSATKTIAPRINVWDSTSAERRKGTLSRAITAGKLTVGVPIDPTICPCGQAPKVSCFGKIALFKNRSDTDANKIPDKILTYENPVNWFFSEIWAYLPEGRAFKPQLADRESALCRWSPNSDLNSLYNQNRYVTPFVYYQLKSIFANIYVNTITGYDNLGRPNHAQMTLEEWKNNYSSRKIDLAVLRLKGVSSQTGGTITYTSGNLDSEVSVGVSLLNDIDGIVDYYTYYEDRRQYVRLFGDLSANAFNTTDTYYMLAYDMFENAVVKSLFISGVTDGGWNVWQEIPYSENNYELILKMAACFGIPFSPTSKESFAAEFTDTDLYLPVIDENGIAHGEYTHGLRNVANPLYDMDGIRDINYDPAQSVDPNTYSDTTNWNNVNFRQAFTKRYILNSTQVAQLSGELWAAQSSKPDDLDYQNYSVDEYLTNNPIDTIVSLKYFPCTFSDVAPAIVHLGKYTTNIACTALGTSVRVIDFDPISVWRHFGDFRDFEPYTQISVYIPFCGVVPLKTADCMGKYISVKLCIDTATGAAAGFVIVSDTGSGGICIATANGTAAIDIPVSGLQSANISNAVFNAAATWAQTQLSNFPNNNILSQFDGAFGNIGRGFANSFNLNNLKGTLFGGPLGALTAVSNLNPLKMWANGAEMELQNSRAEYNLQHIQMPTRLIGSSAPALSSVMETAVRLIIYRPITDEKGLENYADTVGFATLQSGTVSQFSGFTVGTIDVSGINATAAEKQAIAAAFANGVYL